MAAARDGRWRYYWVAEEAAFAMIFSRWALPAYVECRWLDGVPDDAEVVYVRHNPMRKCFGFLIRHESFPVCPEGDEIPWFGTVMVETVRVARSPASGDLLAYRTLREENARLRLIFSDMAQDDERIRLAHEQGKADEAREARDRAPSESWGALDL